MRVAREERDQDLVFVFFFFFEGKNKINDKNFKKANFGFKNFAVGLALGLTAVSERAD